MSTPLGPLGRLALAAALIAIFLVVGVPIRINAASSQTFTVSGTFTGPIHVTSLRVEGWGGGGFGGPVSTIDTRGAGGGGGGYCLRTAMTIHPGGSYAVTVGTGGVGTFGSTVAASASSFTDDLSVQCIANAGGDVALNTRTPGGTGGGGTGDTTFTGGSGAAGQNVTGGFSGGGGSSAGTASNGNTATTQVAAVNVTGGGAGGNGVVSGASQGNGGTALSNPGGGGGGSKNNTVTTANRNGGNGTRGQVILTWLPLSFLPLLGVS